MNDKFNKLCGKSGPVVNSRFGGLIDDKKRDDRKKDDRKKDDRKKDDKKIDDKKIDDKKIDDRKKDDKKKDEILTPKEPSRFNFMNEIKNDSQYNVKKNNLYDDKRSNNRPVLFKDRIQREIDMREKEKERKQKELEQSLQDSNSFPDLIPVTNKEGTKELKLNYIDKVKWVKEEEKKEELWHNSDGFELLGGDNVKKIIQKQRKPVDPNVILKALGDKYENWKAEYIEDYGYDDYEHNFRFPNYDYEYFDKLDEIYANDLLEEEEKEREKEQAENYVTNYNED